MTAYVISAILQNVLLLSLRFEKNSFPKPLSLKKEKEYFSKMKNKNKKARDMLIKHNLRLVAHIVKKYYVSTSDHDDLISTGTIGLIKAVESYDYNKGIKFATYASRCIENEILMYFRQNKKSSNDLYINDAIFSSKNSEINLFSNMITGNDYIVDLVELKCKSTILYDFIKKFLKPRERKVLILRYGLFDRTPLTQQETARRLNISRSYVSRIEKKAIKILESKFKENGVN